MKRGIPFVLALASGIACLAILGGTQNTFQLAVTATVFVMAAYLAWILWSERLTRMYERYADSFYYLGFMLTLFALLIAFLGGAQTNEGLDLEAILNKFGLGLVTTLVGLAGRIALIEFSGGIEETTEDALSQVRHSAQTLAVELTIAGRSIQQANSDLASAVALQQKTVAEAIEGNVQSVVLGLGSLQQGLFEARDALGNEVALLRVGFSKGLSGALDEVGAKAKQVSEGAAGVANAASQGIAESVSQLSRKIAKLDIPSDLLRDVFTRALQGANEEFVAFKAQAQGLVRQTAALTAEFQTIQGRTTAIKHTLADIGEMSEQLRQMGETARSLTPAMETMYRAISELAASVSSDARGMSDSARQLHSQLNNDVSTIKQIRAQLEQEIQQSTDAVRRVHQSLVDNVKYITDKLGT